MLDHIPFGHSSFLLPSSSVLRHWRWLLWLRLHLRGLWSGFWLGHHRDKNVRDARGARITKRGELVAIDPIEQENVAPEHLPFRNRLQRARICNVIRMDHH